MSANLFLTKWSEISGDRFDPQMVLYNRKTHAFKYKPVSLKLLLSDSPMYGANEAGIARKSENEPRYIRITDINEFGNLKGGLGVTAEMIDDKYFLKENDLLFARSGATVGKAYLHKQKKYDCFFAGYMIKFKIDPNKIDPYFVFLYTQLNVYKEWTKAIQRAAGQPNINAEEYKNLPIPVPPASVQKSIIHIIEQAYHQKKQAEKEADRLLQSIDDYLLGELGIKQPQTDNKNISKRVYLRKWSEVSGERFDPAAYSGDFSFEGGHFNLVKFIDYLKIDPLVKVDEKLEATFLPMEKISDKYGEADISLLRSMSEAKGYTKFEDNDLLWSKITPCMENGKSAVVRNLKNKIGFGSTEYFVFRPIKSINIDYVHSLLRLKVLRKTATNYFTGTSGHQRVSNDFFIKLQIPFPPIEKQNEIAEYINATITKAKVLKEQAIVDFEKAKTEVEKMILEDTHD